MISGNETRRLCGVILLVEDKVRINSVNIRSHMPTMKMRQPTSGLLDPAKKRVFALVHVSGTPTIPKAPIHEEGGVLHEIDPSVHFSL